MCVDSSSNAIGLVSSDNEAEFKFQSGTTAVHFKGGLIEGEITLVGGVQTAYFSNMKLDATIHFEKFPGSIVIDHQSYVYGSRKKEGRNLNSLIVLPDGDRIFN